MKRILSLLLTSILVVGCGSSENSEQAQSQHTPSASPLDSPPPSPPAGEPTEGSDRKVVTYEQLLETADQLIENRDFTNATRVLSTAIKAQPTLIDAYVKRSAIFAEARLYKQAAADMSSVLGVEPNNPKFRNTRGYFWLMLEEYEAAERDFNKAIDLDHNYAQAFNNRGLVFIGQGDFLKALNDFRKASELKADYVDAMNNLGFVFLQMEDPDPQKAVETFTKVLEVDNNYLNAVSNRGRAYLVLGNFEKAIADFTSAIEKQPTNEQYYMHRSEAHCAAGNFDLARDDLNSIARMRQFAEVDRMIKNNPQRKELWLTRAQLLLADDQVEEAKQALEKAIELNDKFIPSLLSRARLYEREEEFDEAAEMCSRILEIEPNTEALSLRGDVYFAIGKLDEAIADYHAARRFDSKVVEAYQARADKYEQEGQADLAAEDRRLAESMTKGLSESPALNDDDAKPREMVIQPVNYEEQVTEEEAEDSD